MKINLPKTKPTFSISRFLPIPIFRLGIITLVFFPFLLLSSCGTEELIKTYNQQLQQMNQKAQEMMITLEYVMELSEVLSKHYPGEAGASFDTRSSNYLGVDLTKNVNYIASLQITFADKSWENLTEQKRQKIAENTVKLVNQEYAKLADADYIYVIFMYQDQNCNLNPVIYSNFTFQKTDNGFQMQKTK
ncbi:MAG: hypothetical protein F6K23_09860 [Okeania sp. SIO2C9]|uniref:hypothetical protein n=1 Tax=Okeania sp. SIO2C9 TaxID=2607791 RepID=UPI0013C084BC|nr:hypothetical protein [Okeania sp. SIO2C9]NEQ73349.1 hypothetical protein [Okeania sp. SIO2C9]